VLIGLLCWGVVYALLGQTASPGGPLFSLAVLCIAAHFGGWLMSLTTLPPLIGMLLTGLLLQNVGLVHIAGEYSEVVSVLRYGSYQTGVGQAITSPIRRSVTTRVWECVFTRMFGWLICSFVVYLIVHAFPVRVRDMAQRHITDTQASRDLSSPQWLVLPAIRNFSAGDWSCHLALHLLFVRIAPEQLQLSIR
jgi:hypothetical protein